MTTNPGISRSDFLRYAVVGTIGVASSCATTHFTHRRPNFVVVFTDDQTYRAIGYNNSIVKTPNLDRMAREGLIFDRFYIASPICVASRASMMSGVYPQRHGSVALDASGFQHSVVEEKRFTTFPHHLAAAGYTTAFCGKSHLGDPKAYGFTEGKENGDIYDDESFAFAKQFLTSRTDTDAPFLLWIAPHQPHVPLLPKQEWLDLYANTEFKVDPDFRESPTDESINNQGTPGQHYYRDSEYKKNYKGLSAGPPRTEAEIIEFTRAYYATISHLDHQVGELDAQLKASGFADNTVFIYASDNGYHLGSHGLGNKITMHEESVRVPMFVRMPKAHYQAARTEALASSVDLYPTLLDLAGVALPGHLMGESLKPVLANPKRKVRDYVVSECIGVGGKTGEGHRMVRGDRWKYVLTDTNEEYLFDEGKDPFELSNVVGAPANATVLKTMRAELRAWMARAGDTHQPPPSA